jgi:hypothetical protein
MKKISITTAEGIEDFNLKSRMLASQFSIANLEAVYTNIFGSTDTKCKILPKSNEDSLEHTHSISNVSYKDLPHYIEKYPMVALYPCSFDAWDGKPYPTTINSINCILELILDFDEVSSKELPLLLKPVMNMKIQPNYIVNSGHGIHLHYVLSEPYYMKAAIGMMARIQNKTDPYKCSPKNIVYQKKEFTQHLDTFKDIKPRMLSWFKNSSTTYKLDDIHLALPVRMFCSKTKNPDIYTIPYLVSDVKHSLEEIAEFVGIEIPPSDQAREWNSKMSKQPSKVTKKKIDTNIPTKEETPVRKHSRRIDINFFKTTGQQKQYQQFVQMIRKNAREGNRRNSLYVFWQRAPLYTKNKALITKDFEYLLDYFQTLSSKPLTVHDIQGVLVNSVTGITNINIFKKIGLNVRFENKRKELRTSKKNSKKELRTKIIETSKEYLKSYPKTTYRELADILKIKGFSISYATLYRIEELKFLFQKCILDHEKTKENPLYCNILDYNSNIESPSHTPPLYVAHK